MPKVKTHKGAAKRFKFTSSGKIKRSKAFRSHLLEHKSPEMKRDNKKGGLVSDGDFERVKKMLPYS